MANPTATDRHVGLRLRQRRVELGLTQQQLSALIGVTYQQAHKYEKGINRIASGRLYAIAHALNIEVGYFFEGLASGDPAKRVRSSKTASNMLEAFNAIDDAGNRALVIKIAQALGPADG